MKSTELVQLERDIEKMEKDLSSLYQKRVTLLEGILAEAKQAEKAVTSQSPAKSGGKKAKSQRSAAPKKKARATGSKAKTQKKQAKKPAKKAGAPLPTKVIHERLQKAVTAGGEKGLSASEISKSSGVNYKTTLRNLKKMKNLFTQTGEGSSARYTSAK